MINCLSFITRILNLFQSKYDRDIMSDISILAKFFVNNSTTIDFQRKNIHL